jgi:hypothetical protein
VRYCPANNGLLGVCFDKRYIDMMSVLEALNRGRLPELYRASLSQVQRAIFGVCGAFILRCPGGDISIRLWIFLDCVTAGNSTTFSSYLLPVCLEFSSGRLHRPTPTKCEYVTSAIEDLYKSVSQNSSPLS